MKISWLCRLLSISAFSLSFVGCTSNVKDVMNTETTMKDIVGGNSVPQSAQIVSPINSSLVGYTRTAINETEVLFPELPNPRLVMYVHPHMTPEGTPIPGYSVPLSFYESTQYAMPGELFGWE